MLERLDPNPEYWEGKRGACVGVFQMIIAGREDRQALADVMQILRNTSNPQVNFKNMRSRLKGSIFLGGQHYKNHEKMGKR